MKQEKTTKEMTPEEIRIRSERIKIDQDAVEKVITYIGTLMVIFENRVFDVPEDPEIEGKLLEKFRLAQIEKYKDIIHELERLRCAEDLPKWSEVREKK
jgi:hypothetical protein